MITSASIAYHSISAFRVCTEILAYSPVDLALFFLNIGHYWLLTNYSKKDLLNNSSNDLLFGLNIRIRSTWNFLFIRSTFLDVLIIILGL